MLFSKESLTVSEELLRAIDSYIDEHYVEEKKHQYLRSELLAVERETLSDSQMPMMSSPMPMPMQMPKPKQKPKHKPMMSEDMVNDCAISAQAYMSIDDLVGNLDEQFSSTLLRLIDAAGKKDSEIYNRANIDRRLFSKIRSNKHYTPSKPTVLAFAIALELNLDQTKDLLKRAGFALSHSRKFDVIIEYFIKNRRYDIFEINEVLFNYDQPLLGG